MGTDITLVAEELQKDGKWIPAAGQPYEEGLFVWRDYNVFRTLCATIRPVDEPYVCISQLPRGIPADVHKQTRSILTGPFSHRHCHTFSWASGVEIEYFITGHDAKADTLRVGLSHFAAVCRMIMHPASHRTAAEFRFVFGFDN